MKHLLLTAIAAVLLVGCGPSEAELALMDAAIDGNIEAVKQHLAAGTKVDAIMGFDGRTPLLGAVRKGHKEIAEMLIDRNPDMNALDNNGDTPLDLASGKTADLLRKHGGKTAEELKAQGK